MIKSKRQRQLRKAERPRLYAPPEPINENGRPLPPQESIRRTVYLSCSLSTDASSHGAKPS